MDATVAEIEDVSKDYVTRATWRHKSKPCEVCQRQAQQQNGASSVTAGVAATVTSAGAVAAVTSTGAAATVTAVVPNARSAH